MIFARALNQAEPALVILSEVTSIVGMRNLFLIFLLSLLTAQAEQAWVALSKVGGLKGYKGQVALFGVKEELSALTLEFRGPGADAFAIADARKEENGLLFLEIEFKPTQERGYFSAELVVGQKAQIVQLRGVAIIALEGKNEPPLQEILKALGTGVDAGGPELSLNTEDRKIGDSLAASQFEPVEGEQMKLTPLARYSPPGRTPFGFAIEQGKELQLRTLGHLAATTNARPDAHQSLRPPLDGDQSSITVAEPPKRFGLFLKAHRYTSLTFPGRSEGASIKHTARIYPVKQFEGRAVKNAYLVGFEEASNGDYQDAVFLIEGVKATK